MQLSNALAESVSISIHVYGGDIGKILVMRSMPMVRHTLSSPVMRTLSLRPLMISGRSKPKFVIDHAALKESKQHLSEKQH